MDKALRKSVRFDGIHSIYDMAADASKIYQLAIIRVKVGFNS